MATIKAAGLKVGISTHSHEELAIALAAEPDYVALGPIYETKLKVMKFGPQGLDRIADWKVRIGSIPLCAIGGITPGACARRAGRGSRHAWRSSRISSRMPTRRHASDNG